MSQSDAAAGRGFQFPGQFEITAMGLAQAQLEQRVPALLSAAGLSVSSTPPRVRPSRQGNYVSVTVEFSAASRDDYDAAHATLRACPDVKWTL